MYGRQQQQQQRRLCLQSIHDAVSVARISSGGCRQTLTASSFEAPTHTHTMRQTGIAVPTPKIPLPLIGGFKGGGRGGRAPPPNLAANKFQERPSGASTLYSRVQENLLAARTPPRTPLGELIYSAPQTP